MWLLENISDFTVDLPEISSKIIDILSSKIGKIWLTNINNGRRHSSKIN